MFDTAVKVEFKNPIERSSTNFVGFYDQDDYIVDPYCILVEATTTTKYAKTNQCKKNGKLEFNFDEATMVPGRYGACLMDGTDEDDEQQIGICQNFKVYNPNCSKIDTKKKCGGNCTWKKDKCK